MSGIEDASSTRLAFGRDGTFRAWPADTDTVSTRSMSTSAIADRDWVSMEMNVLIKVAHQHDVHALVGGIDVSPPGSLAWHDRLSFKHAGILPQFGFKLGRWLDRGGRFERELHDEIPQGPLSFGHLATLH